MIIKKYISILQKTFRKEKKPFTTIPSAYKAIDDLRNQHERDQKKMSQLEEINEYVQELQRFYENA